MSQTQPSCLKCVSSSLCQNLEHAIHLFYSFSETGVIPLDEHKKPFNAFKKSLGNELIESKMRKGTTPLNLVVFAYSLHSCRIRSYGLEICRKCCVSRGEVINGDRLTKLRLTLSRQHICAVKFINFVNCHLRMSLETKTYSSLSRTFDVLLRCGSQNQFIV